MSRLSDYLEKNGRFPEVTLSIHPLDKDRSVFSIRNFLSYSFDSSILIPVDTFSFTMASPGSDFTFLDICKEGDSVSLSANGATLAIGTIDVIEVETTKDQGEIVTIHGRDFLGQWEDQNVVDIFGAPLYANSVGIEAVVSKLKNNTKVKGPALKNVSSVSGFLSSDLGESKIACFQRFCESLNIIFWMSPDGVLNVGKPSMDASPSGDIFIDRNRKQSNVLSIKATYASTQIPNYMAAIYAGQEGVQDRISKKQIIKNPAEGPSRLRNSNYPVIKANVCSYPTGSDPVSITSLNVTKAYKTDYIYASALRDIARANVNELIIQANVAGHYNDNLEPFSPDTVYNVKYPRANVEEKMYLFHVQYSLSEQGQRTSLYFTKLGTIVSGAPANA